VACKLEPAFRRSCITSKVLESAYSGLFDVTTLGRFRQQTQLVRILSTSIPSPNDNGIVKGQLHRARSGRRSRSRSGSLVLAFQSIDRCSREDQQCLARRAQTILASPREILEAFRLRLAVICTQPGPTTRRWPVVKRMTLKIGHWQSRPLQRLCTKKHHLSEEERPRLPHGRCRAGGKRRDLLHVIVQSDWQWATSPITLVVIAIKSPPPLLQGFLHVAFIYRVRLIRVQVGAIWIRVCGFSASLQIIRFTTHNHISLVQKVLSRCLVSAKTIKSCTSRPCGDPQHRMLVAVEGGTRQSSRFLSQDARTLVSRRRSHSLGLGNEISEFASAYGVSQASSRAPKFNIGQFQCALV